MKKENCIGKDTEYKEVLLLGLAAQYQCSHVIFLNFNAKVSLSWFSCFSFPFVKISVHSTGRHGDTLVTPWPPAFPKKVCA